ncbi:MAG TPA: branched-chain amino acid ABC transporter permease [Acidimicrobiales bacterium]|nr:branched-chain amino acid ABC transporter permease [Acidimicrobiales bacterium]
MLRHAIIAVVGLAVVFGVTGSTSSYQDFQISQIGAYLMAIAGLTLLTGLNGQISLGHGALMMVGAYTLGLLEIHTGLPLAADLAVATGAASLAGVVIGLGAARLRGPYLAGATLALAVGLPELPFRWPHTLGGDTGLTVNPPAAPSFLGASFSSQEWLAWVSWICVAITLVVVANIMKSRYGRVLRAVRDDETAASLSGISVPRTQVLAFVVSSGCAGLGGAVFALGTGIVNPTGFPLTLSVALLTGMVVGGLGSLLGALWGAILVVYLPQWSQSLSDSMHLTKAVSSNLAFGFYGVVLVVAMLVFPGGIQGGFRRAVDGVRARRARRPVTATGVAGTQ